MIRRWFLAGLLALCLIEPACIWRLWTEGEPIELKIFDVYGNVQSITQEQLVIQTKKGEKTFVIVPSSIKGGDFQVGALVHVYYKKRESENVVTMVVEKID